MAQERGEGHDVCSYTFCEGLGQGIDGFQYGVSERLSEILEMVHTLSGMGEEL